MMTVMTLWGDQGITHVHTQGPPSICYSSPLTSRVLQLRQCDNYTLHTSSPSTVIKTFPKIQYFDKKDYDLKLLVAEINPTSWIWYLFNQINIRSLDGGLIWPGLRVDWLPLVADISNESLDMVSSVGGGLDPAIGEGYHKLALHIALEKEIHQDS